MVLSVAHAQIGYQVALLNSATGEPRANETVKAEVVITDSQNGIVCSETQTVTSNDFGILSFMVGNKDTFKDVAIGKLPMSIAVTVDDVLIGKSQILNVPVAEVATTLKSDFTLEELCGKTWRLFDYYNQSLLFTFDFDNYVTIKYRPSGEDPTMYAYGTGYYEIEGNNIYIYADPPADDYYSHKRCITLRWRRGTLWLFSLNKI